MDYSHGFTLQKEFGDLWGNIRHKVEHPLEPERAFRRGEAVQSSLLRHCFPFGLADNVFMQTVESVLSTDGVPSVCSAVCDALFGVYFTNARHGDPLPLLRVVTKTQSEASQVLCALPDDNAYLAPMLMNQSLIDFLKACSGLPTRPDQEVQPKRLLFVSECDAVATSMAMAFAKKHGGRRVEVFGALLRASTADDDEQRQQQHRAAASDSMAELGIELREVVAGSLPSVRVSGVCGASRSLSTPPPPSPPFPPSRASTLIRWLSFQCQALQFRCCTAVVSIGSSPPPRSVRRATPSPTRREGCSLK